MFFGGKAQKVLVSFVLILAGASMANTSRANIRCKASDQSRADERNRMVETQIKSRGITDTKVLRAMRCVPRHLFVLDFDRKQAYEDTPLSIGKGQTISQPYIVAFMTQAAELKPTDRVLEIGTGSGYQTAVLAEIVHEVYTIEIVPEFSHRASKLFHRLHYTNIHTKIGDGYKGWPAHAPFDAIFVTAAPGHIPPPLIKQLRVGGRIVIPLGGTRQHLIRITKTKAGLEQESLLPVRFVPMQGIVQHKH